MNDKTNAYIYGNDVEWDGSNYVLKDTISAVWKDNYQNLAKKYHYTCFNDTGVCSDVRYFYSFNLSGNTSLSYYYILSGGKKIEEAIEEMVNPVYDSTIKGVVDSWYKDNLENYTSALEDTIWCNEKTFVDGGLKSKDSSGLDFGYFSTADRNTINIKPDLSCPNLNDSYTVNSDKGNRALTYPVALLTADELTIAGSGRKGHSAMAYLHTGQYWRTMTPYYFNNTNPSMFIKHEETRMSYYPASNVYGVRPAISLKVGTLITGGNGTVDSPYIVE